MFKINIGACEVVGLIPGHVIERATLSDSVGFLQGLRFPPRLHYESPNIVYRINNVLVTLGSQFNILKKTLS
jgi:hypothetical protein